MEIAQIEKPFRRDMASLVNDTGIKIKAILLPEKGEFNYSHLPGYGKAAKNQFRVLSMRSPSTLKLH